MPELLRESHPVARKQHYCCDCNSPIAVGTRYWASTYAYDGVVFTWRECDGCHLIAVAVYEWADYRTDGVGAEDFAAWAWELRDDPEHGEAARAYLARTGQAVA